MTFNYTSTVGRLLDNTSVKTGKGFAVNQLVHVHGYYDNRMIMCVANILQNRKRRVEETYLWIEEERLKGKSALGTPERLSEDLEKLRRIIFL